ncbi:5946_t:CDS:2 [Ambispora gerdemannii]|uniref:5946_t:CDS:1 n=1 Tax=Ambispora gerdemannii TaxID=144530 RepID=A0A9N8YN43_9GLOM|nr:5946_t:CDS:2 [Ambispora gerdemannii]
MTDYNLEDFKLWLNKERNSQGKYFQGINPEPPEGTPIKSGVFAEIFPESAFSNNIKSVETRINNTDYRLIEIPGINNPNISELTQQIVNAVDLTKGKISQILFTVDGRITPEVQEAYELISSVAFAEDIGEFISIICTKYSNFEDEEACQAEINLLKNPENPQIAAMFKNCREIVHVNNPSLSGQNVEPNQEVRQLSREKLIASLKKCQDNYQVTNLEQLPERIEKYLIKKAQAREEERRILEETAKAKANQEEAERKKQELENK